MRDIISCYINLSNNDLSLVLHCRLREFYAYKKACEIAIEYLYANNYKGLIEISLDKSRESISKLITLANIRMIKPDVTEDSVDINVDNVIFVLREIMYNYIGRIKDLGHDLYSDTPVLEREVEITIKRTFDIDNRYSLFKQNILTFSMENIIGKSCKNIIVNLFIKEKWTRLYVYLWMMKIKNYILKK